jgi:hypothetical protein
MVFWVSQARLEWAPQQDMIVNRSLPVRGTYPPGWRCLFGLTHVLLIYYTPFPFFRLPL